jgi:hypothetical protein
MKEGSDLDRAQIGDDCLAGCGGVYSTYRSVVFQDRRIRKFRCNCCGHQPEFNRKIYSRDQYHRPAVKFRRGVAMKRLF